MLKSDRPILVVEDNEDIRETLCEILRDEGYRVFAAANGRDALTWLRSHESPCLIVLDLRMPVMDGAEFRLHQLADAALARIPVVVMSAATETSEQLAILRDCAHLRKPVDLDDVLAIVARACSPGGRECQAQ